MKKLILSLLGILLLLGSCKSPEARRPVTQKSGSYINESIERNKKIVAAQEEQILAIIENDSANTYLSSPNGFWYYYNEKDSTAANTPEFGDVVEFDYNLKTLDGETIYSREELSTRTYVMDKEKLFSGMREGLKLMKEGETVTFLFPSHKAYGYYGDKKKIGADIPVISTVTLKKITEENKNQNQ
ncbi:MAG TPA: gliding motility-associated peptidyl-prolyl isomerase GldI [Salinimicrobium catena]|uniref:Peptidyl-prolyl cis-trans isomerase n=1 Tax=Salinimicrobium catena TaxID=390640 RepID=A0A7C2M3H9_9FLAO|nr:gliding motility-associated peptidyl-prolyl isomerase GldI [Salinimicrobium catena]